MDPIQELANKARHRAADAYGPSPPVEEIVEGGSGGGRLPFIGRVVAEGGIGGTCVVHALQGKLNLDAGDYPDLQEVANPSPVICWVGANAWNKIGDVVLVVPISARVTPSWIIVPIPEGLAWAEDPGVEGLASVQDNPDRAKHLGS